MRSKLINGGGVPGGHNVIYDGIRTPHIPSMRECRSIPLRYSDIVIDIGAYVGTNAITCARYPVKKVIAYEPTPETFKILSLTSLPNLEIKNIAVVGTYKPTIDLYISKGIGVTNSTVLSNQKKFVLTVPAVHYTDAIKGASIIKIDIEGGEYNLPIENIPDNIRAIIIDFHPIPKMDWIKKAEDIIRAIQEKGFKTIINPKWDCGWTRAGSWMRDRKTTGKCKALISGKQCCGCGKKINAKQKALCYTCFNRWSKKHKKGFILGGKWRYEHEDKT